MNKKESSVGKRSGIGKITGRNGKDKEVLAVLLNDVLQTREARQFATTFVPEFLEVWSNNSKSKQLISKFAGYMVKKQLARPDDASENKEIQQLFKDESFIKNLGNVLPGIINGNVDALSSIACSMNDLSVEDRKQLLYNVLTLTGKGRSGALLTDIAKTMTDIHKADPEFFARTLEPGFRQWVESMDFGELKEAVDQSGDGALALVEMVNTILWQYPSKVIGIFSLFPSLANFVTGSLEISVGKLNDVPPDLLADIITALLNEVDGKRLAGVIDELSEISRKLYVGSALIGEPGSPQLENALAAKVDGIVSDIDARIFWKGRIALAQLKASVEDGLAEAVGNDPELLKLSITKGSELYNIRLRSKNKKIAQFETMDEAELSTLWNQKLSALDTQDTAEYFNSTLRLINQIWAANPGICNEFARQFLNALDYDEFAVTSRQVFEELGQDLKPMARAVVPNIVEWVCNVLSPEDDDFEDDASRARKAIASLLFPQEV